MDNREGKGNRKSGGKGEKERKEGEREGRVGGVDEKERGGGKERRILCYGPRTFRWDS